MLMSQLCHWLLKPSSFLVREAQICCMRYDQNKSALTGRFFFLALTLDVAFEIICSGVETYFRRGIIFAGSYL